MLTEERYNKILEALKNKGTITVAEMTECTGASESTIRRDLIALDEMGKLNMYTEELQQLHTSLLQMRLRSV